MTSKKRPSWKSIKQQRQTKQFVGREDHLTIFQDNLTYALDDDRRKFIFNIWGQGGIGKTTLTKKFRKLAEDAELITTYTDESETDVPAVMARFSSQIKKQGHELKKFDERYSVFRQKQQELESDPDAPQGFASFAAKTATKAGIVMARRIPGAGGVFDLMDEEFVADQAGEWTEFVRKKLTNKDEVQLLLEPENILTPLFIEALNDLAEKHDFVLFFDTYERTSSFVDKWLLAVLDEKFGDIPANFMICIAGRHRLDRNKWIEIEQIGVISFIPLTLFTEEEAKNYLERKGISNRKVIDVIIQLSGCLPLLVEMLASGIPNDPEAVGEPSGHAVDRFLLWVDDPQQRQFALDAALLQELNRDTVTLLNGNNGDELFEWLTTMPFIEARSHGWMYHDVVRKQMLRYKRRESAQSWSKIHGQLATHYEAERDALQLDKKRAYKDETWKKSSSHALYHRLCQSPQTQITPSLHIFLDALEEQKSFARHLASIMEMAGADSENEEVRIWGEQLANGLDAYDADDYNMALTMFTRLLQQTDIQPTQKIVVLSFRGNTYRLQEQYEHALDDFDNALQIEPTYVSALNRKGLVYKDWKRYESAIEWFDKALKVDPEHKFIWANRGQAHRLMKKYEKALVDLDKALEIDPSYTRALNLMGLVYLDLKQYESAIEWFDKAIGFDPEYKWAWANRGRVLNNMNEYELALTDWDEALTIDPNYIYALNGKGILYEALKLYELAIEWFDKALKVRPDSQLIWVNRGRINRKRKQYDQALGDFDKALELDPDYARASFQKGLVYIDWEQYETAIEWFDKVLEVDPGFKSVWAHRGLTHRLMKQYEDALADLDKALKLDPEYTWALFQKGLSYIDWEQYENAIEWFDKALEVDSEYKFAWAHRGLTHRLMNRYEEALADLDRALILDPSYKFALTENGHVYVDWNQYDIAIQWFDKITEIDPEYRSAWAFRGWTYRKLKQYDLALLNLNKTLEIDSEYSWAFRQRGGIYLLLEEFDKSFQDLTKAIELKKQDDWNYFILAMYHFKMADLSTAQKNIKLSIGLIKESPQIWSNKFKLYLYNLVLHGNSIAKEKYKSLLDLNPPSYAIQNSFEDIDTYLEFYPQNADMLEIKRMLQNHLDLL